MMQRTPFRVILLSVLLGSGLSGAQKPAPNGIPKRHPNLAAAQHLTAQAYNRVISAQHANEWDPQGHARKAKELLDQANNELKQAAEAADDRD